MQFNTGYQSPMDRGYYAAGNYWPDESPKLEEPIVPLNEIGTTIVEKHPQTGANILQNTEAAIRAGAGNIQIVLSTPSTAAIGGRPKAYGKEVREALKEITKANEVIISGVEMPTSSISNLSGFNPQSGTIAEEKRQEDLEEVKDAIKFVADIADGGGVDIWSQEFPRTIFDASWNTKGKWKGAFKAYPGEERLAVKHLVDDRTGRIIQEIRMNQEISYPVWHVHDGKEGYTDEEGNKIKPGDFINYEGNKITDLGKRVPKYDAEKNTFVIREMGWKDIEEEADLLNKEKSDKLGRSLTTKEELTPQEAFFHATLRSQEGIARGWALNYSGDTDETLKDIEKLKKAREIWSQVEKATDEEEKWRLKKQARNISEFVPPDAEFPTEIIDKQLKHFRQRIESNREMATGQLMQANDLAVQRAHVRTAESYAKEKAIESYAEMGIFSMDEGNARGTKKPLYVGPELGWPQGWGGHPDEFIELISKARERMAERLVQERNVSKHEATERSKKHLKGLFDTGHMGMWLNNFRRKPGETEDQRLEKFKGWYMDQTERLAEAGVVGSIQAVDSASGAHGHLPPGQGILPVVESVKKLKEKGFDGFIVSEGHEEEQFGQNRILLQAWKAFGSPISGTGYPMGEAATWPMVQSGYFRHTYPPQFIVGAYAPSNEWKLWSEVPLE